MGDFERIDNGTTFVIFEVRFSTSAPPPPPPPPPAWEPARARAVFRRLAKRLHPDAGGSPGLMAELNRLYEAHDMGRLLDLEARLAPQDP